MNLYQLLAESRVRDRQIRQIHDRSLAAIPQTLAQILAELERLRSQSSQWIGKDKAIEGRYLRLLEAKRRLEQSLEMGKRRQATEGIQDTAEGEEKDREKSDRLQKMIGYGQMLLDVYEPGVLIKGATLDIEACGRRLVECGDEDGVKIGRSLLKSARVQRVIRWKELAIGVEYLPGDVRFVGTDHERKIHSGYGHFRNYIGMDGEALDCYLFTGFFRDIDDDEPSDRIFEVTQLTKDGTVDELKFMVGYADLRSAKRAYLKEMPRQFFGSIREVAIGDLKQYKKQGGG